MSEALAHFQAHPPRGEYTLVIAGASAEEPAWDDEAVLDRIADLVDEGWSSRDAVRQVADEAGRPRQEVYRLWTHQRADADTRR